jgi:hypothetical protein
VAIAPSKLSLEIENPVNFTIIPTLFPSDFQFYVDLMLEFNLNIEPTPKGHGRNFR